MRAKRILPVVLAGIVGMVTMGCGASSKDYDIYLYNTKSEIADSIQDLCSAYEQETGVRVKVYTCGTTEGLVTLRSEMNSKNQPTIYSVNQASFQEWYEGRYALSSNEIENQELKSIYEAIPDEMKLSDEAGASYGIPYNIEGYGLIADTRMICDVFGLDTEEDFTADFRAAEYPEFEQMVIAVNDYIDGEGGKQITLNGNTYTTATEKTALTENLNGVFAIAGAEKWTYGNHYVNYALNAVFPTYHATANATVEQVRQIEEPLVKIVKELDFLSSYTAGQKGKVLRGPDYINSTVTGYDQAVQTFAEGKSLFIKNGNWIFSNVESIDAERAAHLTMLPMKTNLEDNDIAAEGVTVEKINRSIPEFVSQYYIINAKAAAEERKAAEEFLLWLNTSDTGMDFITNEFAFVPFNADSSVELENPLGNALIWYMQNDLVLGNDFDAFPESWGLNTIGAFIQEKLFTDANAWSEDAIREGVKSAVDSWIESIENEDLW